MIGSRIRQSVSVALLIIDYGGGGGDFQLTFRLL